MVYLLCSGLFEVFLFYPRVRLLWFPVVADNGLKERGVNPETKPIGRRAYSCLDSLK